MSEQALKCRRSSPHCLFGSQTALNRAPLHRSEQIPLTKPAPGETVPPGAVAETITGSNEQKGSEMPAERTLRPRPRPTPSSAIPLTESVSGATVAQAGAASITVLSAPGTPAGNDEGAASGMTVAPGESPDRASAITLDFTVRPPTQGTRRGLADLFHRLPPTRFQIRQTMISDESA